MGMRCSFSHNDGNLGMRTQHGDEMIALVSENAKVHLDVSNTIYFTVSIVTT